MCECVCPALAYRVCVVTSVYRSSSSVFSSAFLVLVCVSSSSYPYSSHFSPPLLFTFAWFCLLLVFLLRFTLRLSRAPVCNHVIHHHYFFRFLSLLSLLIFLLLRLYLQRWVSTYLSINTHIYIYIFFFFFFVFFFSFADTLRSTSHNLLLCWRLSSSVRYARVTSHHSRCYFA